MSKYEKAVFDVLSDKKIKSTNEVVKEVENSTGHTVNWHMIYRVLLELSHEGKVERLEAKVGFFWKRKKEYYLAAEEKGKYTNSLTKANLKRAKKRQGAPPDG